MRKLRTIDQFTEDYFRAHPEEIDAYLTEISQDFAEDNDPGALLASLRVLAPVHDVRIDLLNETDQSSSSSIP